MATGQNNSSKHKEDLRKTAFKAASGALSVLLSWVS